MVHLGAVYQAASMSKLFRVKKFIVKDANVLPIQVHVGTCTFDLDPASWAALVAQLVRASVRSTECCGLKSHLRQLIFHFFICLRCLSFSFFLSFFSSQVIMYMTCDVCTLYMM